LICKQIVSYLFEQQLQLTDCLHIADQLEPVLSVPKLEHADAHGTGEEATPKAVEVSDSLAKKLRESCSFIEISLLYPTSMKRKILDKF
jgi:hypothetical protein